MRIVQLLPTLTAGDAVSNDARALQRLLRRWDRQTEIYAENISPYLPAGSAARADELPELGREDVRIYHMSIGSAISHKVDELCCRKVMIYHNITPPKYFEEYSRRSRALTENGYWEMKTVAPEAEVS